MSPHLNVVCIERNAKCIVYGVTWCVLVLVLTQLLTIFHIHWGRKPEKPATCHNVVSCTSSHGRDSNSLVLIDTKCTDSCKTNSHTITVTMAATRWVFEHTIYCTGYEDVQYYTNEACLCNVNTKKRSSIQALCAVFLIHHCIITLRASAIRYGTLEIVTDYIKYKCSQVNNVIEMTRICLPSVLIILTKLITIYFYPLLITVY